MARSGFSTSNYLLNSNAVASGTPITISAWFTAASLGAAQGICWIANNSGNINGFGLAIRAANSLGALSVANGTQTQASSSISVTAGSWHHGCAVFASATSRTVYLDGGNSGTDATSNTPASLVQTSIGIQPYQTAGGVVNPLTGKVADVAIWNVVLTAAEISALASGVRPYLIRPANLIGYWPIDGIMSPEPDSSGNQNNMGLTGSPTAASGPPITLFTRKAPTFWFIAGAATVLTLAVKTWSWTTQATTFQFTNVLSSKSWVWDKQGIPIAFLNALSTKIWTWTKQSIATNTVNVLTTKTWNWIGVAFTLVGGATVLTLATASWNWVNQSIIATGGGIIAGGGLAVKEWIIRRRRRS